MVSIGRLLAPLVLLLLPGLWAAGPAGAQGYASAGNAACIQGPGVVVQGQEVSFEGNPPAGTRCFDPGSLATGVLESAPVTLFVVRVDERGGYRSPPARIPTDTAPGTHTLRVSGTLNGRAVEYTKAITVTGAAPRRLPITGRDIALLTLWGIFLVGFGSVLIGASWRRWRAAKVPAAPRLEPAPDRGGAWAAAVGTSVPTLELGEVEVKPASTPAIPLGSEGHAGSGQDRGSGQDAGSAEGTAPVPAASQEEAPGGAPAGAERVQEVVQRASAQTSELVSRLQSEIQSWSRPQD